MAGKIIRTTTMAETESVGLPIVEEACRPVCEGCCL